MAKVELPGLQGKPMPGVQQKSLPTQHRDTCHNFGAALQKHPQEASLFPGVIGALISEALVFPN